MCELGSSCRRLKHLCEVFEVCSSALWVSRGDPAQTRQNRAELVVTRKLWFFLDSRVIKLFSALTEFSRTKPRLTMRGAS